MAKKTADANRGTGKMPYELFESEMKEGFHLEFFQILNWGLFDKQVYTLRADSRSTRRTLTLLQVRYFTGTELQRVFAITESRLSVEDMTSLLASLSRQLDELEGKDRELKGSLQKLQSSQDAMEKKLFAVQSLQELDSWDKLDFASVARTIDTLSDERRKLAASKDIRQKQEMLDQKKEEKRLADSEKEQVIKTLGKFENQLSTAQSSLSQHERTWQAFLALPDFEQTAARAVESLCGEYPRLTKAATMQDADDAGGKMQRELNGKMDTAQRSINGFTTALQAAMNEVKSPNAHLREQFGDWAGEFSDMGTSKEFLPDYQNFYDKLLKDDLPRYRRQFHATSGKFPSPCTPNL